MLETGVLQEAIVPIQALNLMNDVTYVEAARLLAERAMTETTISRDRVTQMFRRVLARAPSEAETDRLLQSFQVQLDHFAPIPTTLNDCCPLARSEMTLS